MVAVNIVEGEGFAKMRGRMGTANLMLQLAQARTADSRERDRICDEAASTLLAAGELPDFEVRTADLDADPYFLCADRYWRSRFQGQPTVSMALECARWMTTHVTEESWGAVAEQW